MRSANTCAGSLSFGQQKLLEFAMALMRAPKMLLLDEPTAGINPTLINGMIDRLIKANAEMGVTLLVIEHNMRVIMNLATHIYCLAHGGLLASGTPEQVRNDPRVLDAYLRARVTDTGSAPSGGVSGYGSRGIWAPRYRWSRWRAKARR